MKSGAFRGRWRLAVAAFLLFASHAGFADERVAAEVLVSEARVAFQHFRSDPELTVFRGLLRRAKGVFIAPEVWEAGIGLGGSGGRGVLLVRDAQSGAWSQPAFYKMGSASLGIQLGVQRSEVVLLVMSRNGVNRLLSSSLELGAGASVAAGPVGTGKEVAIADFLAYSRSKGVFGSLSLKGSVLSVDAFFNAAYYGRPVDVVDILIRGDVSNPHSSQLRADVHAAAGGA